MKSIRIFNTLLFFCFVFLFLQCGNNNIERNIEITAKYLNIPADNSKPKMRMKIEIDGKGYREFDIKLAEEEPEYWVFLELSKYMGEEATIILSDRKAEHKGFEKLYFSDQFVGKENLYHEKYRPQFHFSSMRGWNNDPNGLVFFEGEYHLFYQHNPFGTQWGNMHWGHAVSRDLIHWQELPDALIPDKLGAMFSGSAVIDFDNTSGFQSGDDKVMVAIYTAHKKDESGVIQTQCLAFSNDRGISWEKYADNPVIGDRRIEVESDNIRDPKVFWHNSSEQWVMVLFEGIGNSIFTSKVLKEWEYQSHIDGFWECPELFELAVDNDPYEKKWVMYGASGTYAIGEFDGKNFILESGKHQYHRGNLYAAQTYNNIPESDGRRIQIGWGTIESPGMPFNQMMTFPSVFTLRTTNNGIRLFYEPIKEIENLHKRKYQWDNISFERINKKISGVESELMHIKCEIENINAVEYGLRIGGDEITYDLNSNSLNGFDYFPDSSGKLMYFEILVDKTSIEVYVDHGRFHTVIPRNLESEEIGLEFIAGGKIKIKDFALYELTSIWK